MTFHETASRRRGSHRSAVWALGPRGGRDIGLRAQRAAVSRCLDGCGGPGYAVGGCQKQAPLGYVDRSVVRMMSRRGKRFVH